MAPFDSRRTGAAEYNFPNAFGIQHVCRMALPIHGFAWNTAMADGSYGDHAKWTVGYDRSGQQWFCVQDNNYACTQTIRGGGAFCFPNHQLADAVRKVIGGGECHPSNGRCHFRCDEQQQSCTHACAGYPNCSLASHAHGVL